MKIFYSGDKVDWEGSAVALGNFDGLHIAHMEIINSAVRYAKSRHIKSGVLLFDHHSSEATKTRKVSLIMSNRQKTEILGNSGVDFVYFVKFDEEFMRKSPEEFLMFLLEYLKARCICVGYDYKFGYKAKGDTDLLRKLGKKYDVTVNVTDKVTLDGKLVGSTYIRTLINDSKLEEATRFLGRPFSVEGYVERGLQNGRKMGFPTANVRHEENMILPPDGVYAGRAIVENRVYKSVINVGTNPTFDAKVRTVEAHLLDFNEDIYDKDITVEFFTRLRGEIRFDSVDKLKAQIAEDVRKTREISFGRI